ncbi:hypothetical protein JB92DRAFT_2830424 [Gautieria morchelliformis]|nr:hypothetical protein JB92DRAFT_2830424 [Gautieria morchelliformis]
MSGLKNTVLQSDEGRSPKDDGSLKHPTELTPQQIDELMKLGFTTIRSRSQHKFGDNWNTSQIDKWLCEALPVPFERLDLIADLPDHKYQWRLLKACRWHLELHCEMPKGYDMKSAKGCKSKGWQDTKLFFVTHVPITDIIEAMEDIAMQAKKGKGKTVCQRKAVDSDDDINYNTGSKKRKITGKKSLANSGDDCVIAGPSGQSMKRKAQPDDDDAVSMITVDLEASFDKFEAMFKP